MKYCTSVPLVCVPAPSLLLEIRVNCVAIATGEPL